jgi:hypothetical protein
LGKDRRARTTGKPDRGERFARMTQSLLESEAVATLPGAAFKLLALLALGARPPGMDRRRDHGSNGVQAVTDSYARRFGFNSRDTVYRSLDMLLDRGLIIKTRDGWRSKTHFALYAVAWLPVTHRDGEPLDTPEPANDSWRTWTTPTPKRKKKMPSDGRTQSRPIVGHDESICRPILSRDEQLSRPMVGNTLRVLAPPTDDVSGLGSSPSPSSPSKSKTAISQKKVTMPLRSEFTS